MRTLHLLKTPDILCASDTLPTGSYWSSIEECLTDGLALTVWRPSARNPKNLTGLDAMSALQTEVID
jgi:hypothetical protein